MTLESAIATAQRGLRLIRELRDGRCRQSGEIRIGWDASRQATEVGAGGFGRKDLERANNVTRPARMGRRRLHKASNAESICTHVVRQRGWTKRWRLGKLTGQQHLSLLRDVEQYGRAWLRHEAEMLFERYGVENEGISASEVPPVRGILPAQQGHTGEAFSMHQMPVSAFQQPASDAGLAVVSRGLASRAAGAVGRFFDRARQFVRELIFAGAMTLKGTEDLSAQEIADLDRQARIQAEYLEKFRQEAITNPPIEIAEPVTPPTPITITVQQPPMTSGEFIARAEKYGGSAWQAPINVWHTHAADYNVYTMERRVLGESRSGPCGECQDIARLGWQPVGSLPELGDQECNGWCHCHFEFTDAQGKLYGVPGKPGKSTREPRKRPLPAAPQEPAGPTPGGPGPTVKEPPKLPRPKPPKSEPPPVVIPTLEELLKESGSPYAASEYEEA